MQPSEEIKNSHIEQNYEEQTSNPTTFSTNNILGGWEVFGISSRILRKENALASPECFWRPNGTMSCETIDQLIK